MDVNYHITQYWNIIEELNKKVDLLEGKLAQQQLAAANSKTERRDLSKLTELWGQLKVSAEEERAVRYLNSFTSSYDTQTLQHTA